MFLVTVGAVLAALCLPCRESKRQCLCTSNHSGDLWVVVCCPIKCVTTLVDGVTWLYVIHSQQGDGGQGTVKDE